MAALGRLENLAIVPFLTAAHTRNPVTMTEQARLAQLYVQRVTNGDKNPARSLSRNYPGTSEKTWANRFHRLRTLGFLTDPPRRGIAGGELTGLAEDLLGVPTFSPEVQADYMVDRGPQVVTLENGEKGAYLTDRERAELVRLPIGDDEAWGRWRGANPHAGFETIEDWLVRVNEEHVEGRTET